MPEATSNTTMITSLCSCLKTWFSPGNSFYIPMAATNWQLQRINASIDAIDLSIKRTRFMNAGRYFQDAKPNSRRMLGVGHTRSLADKLAFQAKCYASALQEFLLHNLHNVNDSSLVFKWTRVKTPCENTRVCEYVTNSAIDDCVLAWCTAIALQLALSRFDDASTSAHLLLVLLETEPIALTWEPRQNPFSPPVISVPRIIVFVLKDSLCFLREVSQTLCSGTDPNWTPHRNACAKLLKCFEHATGLKCFEHISELILHCMRVLRDCAMVLHCREVMALLEDDLYYTVNDAERTLRCLPDMNGCSDYVILERNKVEIALFARQCQ